MVLRISKIATKTLCEISGSQNAQYIDLVWILCFGVGWQVLFNP
jgi:hypothetical protein